MYHSLKQFTVFTFITLDMFVSKKSFKHQFLLTVSATKVMLVYLKGTGNKLQVEIENTLPFKIHAGSV